MSSDKAKQRTELEIFEELGVLAQSDGAMHSISAMIYRDWVIKVDMLEGKVVDTPERRWSTSKLNNNELQLLIGLTVQSPSPKTYTVVPNNDGFAERADHLLREFHDTVVFDFASRIDPAKPSFNDKTESLGAAAREAIYYGADSFYLHQFEKFSRHRYREDGDWLLKNVGLSIRPILDIAHYIVDRLGKQMTYGAHLPTKTDSEYLGELTTSLLISKSELISKFGEKAKSFIERFSIPAADANAKFTSPFAINEVNMTPLVDIGDHLFIPNQYRLLQAIYESPFYWMMADPNYRDIAADNRGNFLEKTTAQLFRTVFGDENVHLNVTIHRNRREIAGEADVLVVYGEFVIVVQAKSKRVTIKARAGDADALNSDFNGAIQSPYEQAFEFSNLIRSGAECVLKDGKVLTFQPTVRLFPAVILSDPFPGVTFFSNFMLKRSVGIAPIIWDLGVLDCVARILPTPLDFLFYLKCRSDSFDSIHSDSEYNFLGFHLRSKLVRWPDSDMMMLDRDFATVIDDYMIASDVGVESERPIGVVERLKIPIVSELLTSLKKAPPALASVVIDLYDFSSAALEDVSKQIISLRAEVTSGKALKAFSILTETGGLTYVVCQRCNETFRSAAHRIGAKHKYDNQRDRWYVIVDSVDTSSPVDALLPILGRWKEDADLAENSRQVESHFGFTRREITIGDKKQ